jgi:hypothetical protein
MIYSIYLIKYILACLYGKDQVNLIDGGQRSIQNLKVGDRVWSLSPDGDSLIEDEILLMAQSEPNKTGQ